MTGAISKSCLDKELSKLGDICFVRRGMYEFDVQLPADKRMAICSARASKMMINSPLRIVRALVAE